MGRTSRAALLCLLVAAWSGSASAFPRISIDEIGTGLLGDPNVQFVELRFEASGAGDLTNTRLTVFDKDGVATVLLQTPTDVADGPAGRRVLYATEEFRAATGIVPDYAIPAGIVGPSGMVCWGAPSTPVPDPDSWDAHKPENYVDCVAYGTYAHATRARSGTPTTLRPGDGVRSLVRVKNACDAGDNAADFALAPASPCNGAGACVDLAATPAPTATPTASVTTPSPTPTALASLSKPALACRRAVIRAGSRFSASYVGARNACEKRRLRGKTTGPCPDEAARTAIAAAAARRTRTIVAACGALAPDAIGLGTSCPGDVGACSGVLASMADVSTCLDCSLRAAADRIFALAWASAPDPERIACQRGFGSAIATHYRRVGALLARCEDAAARGKIVGTCPDAKTATRVAAAEQTLRTALCRACGGSDHECNGAPDVPPAALGIGACPARTVPNGPSCGAIAVATMVDAVNCAACVTAFESACASQLAARPTALAPTCVAP